MPTTTEKRDLSAERRAEILDAFEVCVRRHGLQGSSMRLVAAEAGVSQPLLMHHFGSRAGLVGELVDHVVARLDESLLGALAAADADGVVSLLFDGGFTEVVARDDGLFPALHDAATRDDDIRALVADVYSRLQRDLAAVLARTYPSASAAACDRVAYGLLCLLESNELLRELRLPGRDARHAPALARALLGTLETGSDR